MGVGEAEVDLEVGSQERASQRGFYLRTSLYSLFLKSLYVFACVSSGAHCHSTHGGQKATLGVRPCFLPSLRQSVVQNHICQAI